MIENNFFFFKLCLRTGFFQIEILNTKRSQENTNFLIYSFLRIQMQEFSRKKKSKGSKALFDEGNFFNMKNLTLTRVFRF